jgi:hypothetical protein
LILHVFIIKHIYFTEWNTDKVNEKNTVVNLHAYIFPHLKRGGFIYIYILDVFVYIVLNT